MFNNSIFFSVFFSFIFLNCSSQNNEIQPTFDTSSDFSLADSSDGSQEDVPDLCACSETLSCLDFGLLGGAVFCKDCVPNTSKCYSYGHPNNDGEIDSPIAVESTILVESSIVNSTLAFWFRSHPDSLSDRQVVLDLRENGEGVHLQIDDIDGAISVFEDGVLVSKSKYDGYQNSIWHSLVVNSDEDGLLITVNGDYAFRVDLEMKNSSSFAVGSEKNGDNPIRGEIDEVILWNRRLDLFEIQDFISKTLSNRDTKWNLTSIELGAYLKKGSLFAYTGWVGKNFDIISSTQQILNTPQSDGSTLLSNFRAESPIKVWAQLQIDLLEQSAEHKFPSGTVNVKNAQLLRTDGQVAEGPESGTHHYYNPAHSGFIDELKPYLSETYFNENAMDVDGVILNGFPLGRHGVWDFEKYPMNDGIRSRDRSGVIYDSSVASLMSSTRSFVQRMGAFQSGKVIGMNLNGQEKMDGIFPYDLRRDGLRGAWVEYYIRKHETNSVSDKTPLEREQDFILPFRFSQSQIPVVLQYVFDVDNFSEFESMLAYYLLTKSERSSDSVKLAPMPILRQLKDSNSNPGPNHFSTEGYSTQHLFERLSSFRPYLELDCGELNPNIFLQGAFVYKREYDNCHVWVNNRDEPISVRRSAIEGLKYLETNEPIFDRVLIPAASGRVFLK